MAHTILGIEQIIDIKEGHCYSWKGNGRNEEVKITALVFPVSWQLTENKLDLTSNMNTIPYWASGGEKWYYRFWKHKKMNLCKVQLPNLHIQGHRIQAHARTCKKQGNTASKYRLMDIMAFIIHLLLALYSSAQHCKSPRQKYNKSPSVKIFKITKLEYPHSLLTALFPTEGKGKSETTQN